MLSNKAIAMCVGVVIEIELAQVILKYFYAQVLSTVIQYSVTEYCIVDHRLCRVCYQNEGIM
jgi:hypothetical protein